MGEFSKYEVYVDTWSLYYYKDVPVLRNKMHIKDEKLLKMAEEEITFKKAYELTHQPITGRFGITHLFRIHKFMFGDIYSFAGRIRYEEISKGQTKFYPVQSIDRELKTLFNKLKAGNFLVGLDEEMFFEKLTYYMAELNIIHPFREGNGRTIREFIRELALKNGYAIHWDKVSKQELLDASIASVFEPEHLQYCLIQCAEKIV